MESFLTFDIFYSVGIVHAINSHPNLKSKNLSFGSFFYIKCCSKTQTKTQTSMDILKTPFIWRCVEANILEAVISFKMNTDVWRDFEYYPAQKIEIFVYTRNHSKYAMRKIWIKGLIFRSVRLLKWEKCNKFERKTTTTKMKRTISTIPKRSIFFKWKMQDMQWL